MATESTIQKAQEASALKSVEALTRMSDFAYWLKFSTGLSLFVMVLGSIVRSTDSGLSCPDWPLCYEKAIPLFDMHIFLEWFHRLVALMLGFSILMATYKLFKLKPFERKLFRLEFFWILILFSAQVVLGGLTVLKLLSPGVVSTHLMNAVLFLGVLYSSTKKAAFLTNQGKKKVPPSISSPVRRLFKILTILIFAQISLGGSISTTGSASICPEFPTCFGSWWPAGSALVDIQMSHRYLAVLLLLIAAVVAPMMKDSVVRKRLYVIAGIVVVQIALGLVNIYYTAPAWASSLHLANALGLFLMCLGFALKTPKMHTNQAA
jgi:cytochrome c oxidase assembly protein subunit 15